MKLDTFQSKRSYGKRPSDIKFDSDKFISAIQDIKQGVNERLRQWSEYETQLEKIINWLNDSESALKTIVISHQWKKSKNKWNALR